MDNRFISRFWENYIAKLKTYGIKPKGARWYVRHAEQYIRTFPDRRLATHTVQDVEQYLQDKGRKAGPMPADETPHQGDDRKGQVNPAAGGDK